MDQAAEHVEFDTSDYERSHGKAPRGYGSWAFSPTDPRTTGWSFDQSGSRFFQGTYQEAKKQATAWAREQGFYGLWTLS